MSGFYPPPNPYFEDVFNPNDYKTYEELARENDESIDLSNYVKKSGDVMSGYLSTPELATPKISFFDNTTQTTAFTLDMLNDVQSIQNTTNDIVYDEETETTTINNTLNLTNLKFGDTESQIPPFTETHKTDINNNKSKVTGINYDSGLLKTTINNTCHINSLTCGNLNTTHLTGTSGNLQTQINDLSVDTITEEERNKLSLLNIYTDEGQTVIFPDQIRFGYHIQENAFTTTYKNKLDRLDIYDDYLMVTEIRYLDTLTNDITTQNTAFTNTLKTKLESDTLINSQNKLDSSLIADGSISNTEFQSLNGITGNIQTQLDGLRNAGVLVNTPSLPIIPTTFNTQGQWYQGTYSQIIVSFLRNGLHSFNVMVEVTGVNEILKMLTKVQIMHVSTGFVTESLYCGINLDTSTSNQKTFHANLQFMHFIPQEQDEQLYARVFTDYHYKANSTFTALCKCQITKFT